MNKNDFVNTVYKAARKLIYVANQKNPRRMERLFLNVPINNDKDEYVDITAEYEITEDGDVGDLWIDFSYNRGEFNAWIRRPALDLKEIRKAAEELFQISKEEWI